MGHTLLHSYPLLVPGLFILDSLYGYAGQSMNDHRYLLQFAPTIHLSLSFSCLFMLSLCLVHVRHITLFTTFDRAFICVLQSNHIYVSYSLSDCTSHFLSLFILFIYDIELYQYHPNPTHGFISSCSDYTVNLFISLSIEVLMTCLKH